MAGNPENPVQWHPGRSGTASSRCFAMWESPPWSRRRNSRAALSSSRMRLTLTFQALTLAPNPPFRALKALTRARSPSVAANIRNNNLGGMGPGPSTCDRTLGSGHPDQSDRCGLNDLDLSSPYYDKMGASLCIRTHAAFPDALRIRCAAPWSGSYWQRRECRDLR